MNVRLLDRMISFDLDAIWLVVSLPSIPCLHIQYLFSHRMLSRRFRVSIINHAIAFRTRLQRTRGFGIVPYSSDAYLRDDDKRQFFLVVASKETS